jgi:threonine synthase
VGTELFHGPTLAFKDVRCNSSRLMDHVLRAGGRVTSSGRRRRHPGAAVEAFRERDNVDVFILSSRKGASRCSAAQMTTTGAANVHAIAVGGTRTIARRS